MRISVYCASSDRCHQDYHEAARRTGQVIAEAGHTLVYGGSSSGLMGALANGALERGGEVVGIIPQFMTDLEWQHPGLSDLITVDTMRERKYQLLHGSDAVVALPGGCGTLDELSEAITLKRLGRYSKPIIMLNTHDFYTPLDAFLRKMIAERFMNPEHVAMWQLVAAPEDIPDAIHRAPDWSDDARRFAVARD